MYTCSLCCDYGPVFNRNYPPEEFIEGKRNSSIWIVGLNPKSNINHQDNRNISDLEQFLTKNKDNEYFKCFKNVSTKLHYLMGEDNGVCHTDIVKCFSNKFPPESIKKGENQNVKQIVKNCSQYFVTQLRSYQPKMIICNGSYACNAIKEITTPSESHETYYIGEFENKEIIVVLTGFIGRIDNYSRRRLGIQIENLIK